MSAVVGPVCYQLLQGDGRLISRFPCFSEFKLDPWGNYSTPMHEEAVIGGCASKPMYSVLER